MAHYFILFRTISKYTIPVIFKLNRCLGINVRYYSTPLFSRVVCLVGPQNHGYPCFNHFSLSGHQMSSEESKFEGSRNLKYEDICQLQENGEIILIDVREPFELQEKGELPNSINIPLKEVKLTLQILSDKEFELKYGIPKPTLEAPLVFSCAAGVRSLDALNEAIAMGYKKARHYQGGFVDWKKNSKKV